MKHFKVKKLLACMLAIVFAAGILADGLGLFSKVNAGTSEIAVYEKPDKNAKLVEYITKDTVAEIIDAVEKDNGELWYKIMWGHDDIGFEGYAPSEEVEFLLYNNVATFILDDTSTIGLEAFPEDYQALLKPLQEAHPNWRFEPYYVQPTWDTVVKAEMDAESNYVHTTSVFWMKHLSVYNWGTDTFRGGSGPDWILASESALVHYLDPRNFITEENIFLFESMRFNEALHTPELIEAVLKGTFMAGAYVDGTEEIAQELKNAHNKTEEESGSAVDEAEQVSEIGEQSQVSSEISSENSFESSLNLDPSESEEPSQSEATREVLKLTYAETFVYIGKKYNVSPVMLASRCRQEQGVYGSSPLISGKVPGFEGYYNYFNMKASGITDEDIVRNGLTWAIEQGWNTQYKSLLGGSLAIATNYVLKNQDTFYMQKFDVDPEFQGMYWHQYMGAIASPAAEGRTARRSYIDLGVLDSPFVFKIPIYTNRPQTPPALPTDDRNPNQNLASITLNDGEYKLNFFHDNTTYELTVPYECKKLNVDATTASTRAKVDGVGTKDLVVGENEIILDVTAQTGDTKRYTITVTRNEVIGENAEVTGQVKSWNNLKDIVVKLYDATLTDEQIRADVLAGNYSMALDYDATLGDAVVIENQYAVPYKLETVLNGTYKVAIYKPGRYVVAIENVTVEGLDVSAEDSNMWFYGDVNYDGQVNVSDVTQITRYISLKTSVFDTGNDKTKANRLLAANVIGEDDTITVQDVTQFIRYISLKASILDTIQ